MSTKPVAVAPIELVRRAPPEIGGGDRLFEPVGGTRKRNRMPSLRPAERGFGAATTQPVRVVS